jgi:hypothetical protein
MEMAQQKITLNGLARKVDQLANSIEKLSNSIDFLARLVKDGFERLEKRVKSLEGGQEQIILRLDQMTPRFEHNELKKRVKILEDKI